jgi:hypothetical protein
MDKLRKLIREEVKKMLEADAVQDTIDAQIKAKADEESDLNADKKAFVSAKNNVPSSKSTPEEKAADAAQKTFFSKKADELDSKIKKVQDDAKSLETAKTTIQTQATQATTLNTTDNSEDLAKQFDTNVQNILNKPI